MDSAGGEYDETRAAASPGGWKLFFGLSRTPHGVLDVATPAMAALLSLGAFPSLRVTIIGLVTAFAGYTAVYALNDLVDHRVDRERLSGRKEDTSLFDVDAIMVRHPIAQGLLSYGRGLVWCLFWAVVAIVGAWILNPFCIVLFCVAALLETIYCRLLRITHLKIVPSAMVKAIGGLAGVYAVNHDPSLAFVAVVFLWIAAWEVGGQNIANDILDIDDDTKVCARTTATVKGLRESTFRLVSAASMAAFGGLAIYWVSGPGVGVLYPIGAVALGWKLLLEPANRVFHNPGQETAAAMFNRASYVPVSFLILTAAAILFPI